MILHFLGDGIFQSSVWAENKWHDLKMLTFHVITYSLVILIGTYLYYNNWYNAILFTSVTFVTHFFIDFFTSKISHRLAEKKKWGTPFPNFGFFTFILFDQLLHFIQLYLTFNYVNSL